MVPMELSLFVSYDVYLMTCLLVVVIINGLFILF
jgi:hypothetical protein